LLIIILHLFTLPGVVMLVVHQLRLVATNMTTNEMINAHRYSHFWETKPNSKQKVFSNPFNKGGALSNCIDFWWSRRRAELGKTT